MILPRGMGDGAIRCQLEVQRIAGHLASRRPILPGHRHRGAPVQRDTLERLAVLCVVEVDVTRRHPVKRATSPFHARAAAQLNRLRRILGTREMLAGQKLLKAGYTSKETWTALTAGWTPDERSKARILA